MTKKKAWRVYGLRFLSGCGKCLNVWKIVRGVVHIGLKIILRGNQSGTRPLNGKMGVEEGNLEGLIATSGGIVTPKLIDMLVYNANKNICRL